MQLLDWIKRLRKGDTFGAIRAEDWNKIANVLETISGENGIEIYKEASGRGWVISGENLQDTIDAVEPVIASVSSIGVGPKSGTVLQTLSGFRIGTSGRFWAAELADGESSSGPHRVVAFPVARIVAAIEQIDVVS